MGSACGKNLDVNRTAHSVIESSVPLKSPNDFFKPLPNRKESHTRTLEAKTESNVNKESIASNSFSSNRLQRSNEVNVNSSKWISASIVVDLKTDPNKSKNSLLNGKDKKTMRCQRIIPNKDKHAEFKRSVCRNLLKEPLLTAPKAKSTTNKGMNVSKE